MKRKVWFGLLSGNVIEYYDFVLYGLMAPVISRLFFPADNHLASLAATFAVFATGMLIRPLGGFVFGLIGNRIGRRAVLLFSSMTTGLGTLLIGCLPTAETLGFTATALLVVMRLLQGFGMSSEFCSVLVISGEVAPVGKRGFYTSLVHGSAMAGTLVASVIAMAIFSLPESALYSWGWRVPFWIGGLICLNAMLLRRNLPNKLAQPIQHNQQQLNTHKLTFLRMFMLVAANTTVYYMLFVFQSTHMIEMLSIPANLAMMINSLSLVLLVFCCGLGGWVADKAGYRLTYHASLFTLTMGGIPLLILMSQPTPVYCAIGQLCGAIAGGFLLGSSSVLYTELWPKSLRLPGTIIPYNLAVVGFGGTTPLISLYLSGLTGLPWASGIYLALLCGSTLLVTWGIQSESMSHEKQEPGTSAQLTDESSLA